MPKAGLSKNRKFVHHNILTKVSNLAIQVTLGRPLCPTSGSCAGWCFSTSSCPYSWRLLSWRHFWSWHRRRRTTLLQEPTVVIQSIFSKLSSIAVTMRIRWKMKQNTGLVFTRWMHYKELYVYDKTLYYSYSSYYSYYYYSYYYYYYYYYYLKIQQ